MKKIIGMFAICMVMMVVAIAKAAAFEPNLNECSATSAGIFYYGTDGEIYNLSNEDFNTILNGQSEGIEWYFTANEKLEALKKLPKDAIVTFTMLDGSENKCTVEAAILSIDYGMKYLEMIIPYIETSKDSVDLYNKLFLLKMKVLQKQLNDRLR